MKNTILLSLCLLLSFSFAVSQNNALNFDGIDDFTEASSNTLNSLPLTLEAKVQPILRSDGASLSAFPNNVISNDFPWAAGHGFGVVVLANDAGLIVEYQDGIRHFSYPFVSGQWYHIAVVYTSGKFVSYVDGCAVDSLTYAQGSLTSSNVIRYGLHNYDANLGTKNLFKGSIDEARIWTSARTNTEIQATLNTGLVGNEPNLAHYHKFDQSGATTLNPTTGGITFPLNNFAFTGSTSNWVSGAPAVTISNCQVLSPPTAVPTLSQWGLILLALLIMCLGAIAIWHKTQYEAAGKSV